MVKTSNWRQRENSAASWAGRRELLAEPVLRFEREKLICRHSSG